jgi:hypothetical protein
MKPERQLRFSLFLQVFGALMFLVAAIARGTLIGLDPITIFFLIGALGASALAFWTWQQLRDQ